jgi:hypothetical protein
MYYTLPYCFIPYIPYILPIENMANIDGIEPGAGYPRGFILREIIKFILNFEEGVEEPKIREYLFKDYKIKNLKTIKSHLEKLQFDGLIIKKEKSGRSNVWILNYSNRNKVANFIISEYFSKNIFTDEECHETMKIFYSDGMRKFISSNDFYDRFLFLIIILTHMELPKFEENKDNKLLMEWKISNEDEQEIKKIFNSAILKSPSLFSFLYYPGIEFHISFWHVFDKEMLKPDRPKFEIYLTYFIVFSGLYVDWHRYDRSKKGMPKYPGEPLMIPSGFLEIFKKRENEMKSLRDELMVYIQNKFEIRFDSD